MSDIKNVFETLKRDKKTVDDAKPKQPQKIDEKIDVK
jgi:hypothetical protein